MAKTKISEFNANPALNTDIDSINIAEGCAPSGINDAIRELMSQLKDWQAGTSNDPMVIGSSGSLTLNQGTANGVAYLNGSKVVTSGSALTFDGTNLTLGANTFIVKNATGDTNGLRIFQAASDVSSIFNYYNASLAFGVNNTEQMRLTSTGLGIGTSSPTNLLTVGGSVRGTVLVKGTNGASPYIALDHTATSGGRQYNLYAGGVNAGEFNIYDITAGANRVTLDASGNLGLGVTPSAWGSFRAMDYQYNGSIQSYSGGGIGIVYNSYFNGGSWIAKSTGSSGKFSLDSNGGFNYQQASSVTNGSAFTYTTAMTLDASGNLLVGATSFGVSTTRFQASGTGTSYAGIFINESANSQTIGCWNKATSGTIYLAEFGTGSTYNSRGSITYNGTAVAYNTSSDYRLKNVTGALTGYKERLMSLQPKQGTWIADGSEFRGFLAHEFANPYRASVIGEKDAVDAEGKPIMQAMQASSSEVMADLVAMVNELITENASLKARLDAANL